MPPPGVPAGLRPAQPAPQASAPARPPVSVRTMELVQRSWAQVLPISDAAASLFYDRLFELDPSVRALFKSDMAQQKKKLMQTLSVAVDGLNNPARLLPVLEQLGARHAGYMVQEHHYDLVGEALLWTLREGLGESFTPETEAAWKEVYGLVAGVMKKAAVSSATAPKPLAISPDLPVTSPPVPDELLAAPPLSPPPMPQPPRASQAGGDDTLPYHLMAQTRVAGLQPFTPPLPREEGPVEAAVPRSAPAAAPAPVPVSVPLNIPSELTFNVNVNVKLEADSSLRALLSRPATAAPPAPAAAPSASSQGAPSPALMVALCMLVSISTVFALGALGQLASGLTLPDLARLAAPVFTVAALAVGYLWGRGRAPERRR